MHRDKNGIWHYTPRDNLTRALAGISKDLCAAGIGRVPLGKLASAMLKLRPKKS